MPEQLVLTFEHAHEAETAGDKQLKGDEQGLRFYHIRTPLTFQCSTMYRFTLKGYGYGIGKPLDFIWVGYLYDRDPGSNPIRQGSCMDVNDLGKSNGVQVSQYVSESDKHLYLTFGPINRYCNAFGLYYSGHYSAVQKGMQLDAYKVHVTASDKGKY